MRLDGIETVLLTIWRLHSVHGVFIPQVHIRGLRSHLHAVTPDFAAPAFCQLQSASYIHVVSNPPFSPTNTYTHMQTAL